MSRINLLFYIASTLLFSGCISAPGKPTTEGFEIILHTGNKFEKKAKKILLEANKKYDLDKFIFTRKVVIQRMSRPHSHPVLTLNTLSVSDPELFLSTFLHEQMHWFLAQEKLKKQVRGFIKEARKRYPEIPVGLKEGGARNLHSSYLHLAVITLEYDAIKHLFGVDGGTEAIRRKRTYKGLNKIVMQDYDWIKSLLVQKNMVILKPI